MTTFCPLSARVPSIQTSPSPEPCHGSSGNTPWVPHDRGAAHETSRFQHHLCPSSDPPGKDETLHSLLGTPTGVQAQQGRRTQSSKRGFGVQTALESFCSAKSTQMISERGEGDKLSPSELLVLTSSVSQPPWLLLETAAPGRDIPSVLSSHMGSSQQAAKAKLFHHLAQKLGQGESQAESAGVPQASRRSRSWSPGTSLNPPARSQERTITEQRWKPGSFKQCPWLWL